MIESDEDNSVVLIGKGCFNASIKIQNKVIINKLQDNYWKINSQEFKQQNWKQLFHNMIECLPRQIFLGSLYLNEPTFDGKNILKEIYHIKFTNLKLLQLRDNNISNIEDIIFLNCPQLSDLYLSKNNISRVSSLNKFPHFSIVQLQLFNNPIFEISQLSRFRFHFEYYFSNFQFDDQFSPYYAPYNNNSPQQKGPLTSDLSKIFKFNFRIIKKVGIKQNSRINQQKIINMMTKKFPGMYVNG